jgi:agmatinase
MEALCRPTLQPFLDSSTPYDDARYIVIGAPLDVTASHRSGTRFAPNAIRYESQHMETYSLRTGLDLDDITLADMGDVKVSDDVQVSLQRIEETTRLASSSGKIPVLLGGEHTVTLGALRALRPDLVVTFDAHLDLRDRLLGLEMSHGTFMRRALEELDFRLVSLGCRALSREELDFVGENPDRVRVVTAPELLSEGLDLGVGRVGEWLDTAASTYFSVDMDVVDPASAPAVGNPSPGGIGVSQLLDILKGTANRYCLGFDLTEVTPHYDSGLTAIQAAHIVLEAIYLLESASRRR